LKTRPPNSEATARTSRARRRNGAPAGRVLPARRQDVGDARGHGDGAGDDERCAPAQGLGQQAGDDRRAGDAEVSEHAVDPEDLADLLPPLDHHGDADRVVDRGEQADQGETRGDLPGGLRQPRQDRGAADPQKEDRHQLAAVPAVAEPSGRQRAQGERQEAGERQGDQFAVGHAEDVLQRQHHRGVEQHEQVVVDVTDVQERESEGASGHGVVSRCGRIR